MLKITTFFILLVATFSLKAQSTFRKFLDLPAGYANHAIDLKPSGDGGFIILEGKVLSSSNKCAMSLTKLNPKGDIIWHKELASNQLIPDIAVMDVDQSNGGILIGFQSISGSKSDTRIARFDKNGVLGNDTTFLYNTNDYEEITSIALTNDGGFAMTINAAAIGEAYKGYLVKVKFDYSVEWSKKDSISTYSQVIALKMGDLICVGSERMARYNYSGNLSWEKFWTNVELKSICELPDKNLVTVGSGGLYQAIKTDAAGTEIWKKNYSGTGIPAIYPSFHDVSSTPDGHLIFAGSNNPGTAIEYFFAKADKNGNLVWNRSFFGPSINLLNRFVAVESHANGELALLAKYDKNTDGDHDQSAFFKTDTLGYMQRMDLETNNVQASRPIVIDDGKGGRCSVTFTYLSNVKKIKIHSFGDSIHALKSADFKYISRFMNIDADTASKYEATIKMIFYDEDLNGIKQLADLKFLHYDSSIQTWEAFAPKSITPGIGTSYAAILNRATKFSPWTLGIAPLSSVNSNNFNSSVLCFPNPGNDNLNLSFREDMSGSAIVGLYDLQGRKVLEKTFADIGQSSLKLETNHLPQGTYFLKITNNNTVYTIKYLAL